jgi:hypothetical protein
MLRALRVLADDVVIIKTTHHDGRSGKLGDRHSPTGAPASRLSLIRLLQLQMQQLYWLLLPVLAPNEPA